MLDPIPGLLVKHLPVKADHSTISM